DLSSRLPSKSLYKHHSTKAYFSYPFSQNQFQIGYLGTQPSRLIGTLHLRYPSSSPLLTDKIELMFIGKEYIQWTEVKKSANQNIKICEISIILWESSVKGLYQEITELDLPFEIELPDDLPSSLKFNKPAKSKISYKISAKIFRPIKLLKSQYGTKKIEIRCPIKRWSLPVCTDTDIYSSPMNSMIRTSGPSAKGVECEIMLEKTSFGIESTIFVPIRLILNNMKVYVKKIYISLKEYHQLVVKQTTNIYSKDLIKDEVFGDQVMLVCGTLNEYAIKLKMDLNKVKKPIVCSFRDEHVVVWHKIKLMIVLNNAPAISFEKEIKIGYIISEEDAISIAEDRWDNIYYYESIKDDKLSARA
ncbi:9673_t:CDS:1, partial [Scutellospora calospora]